jgi:type II secretory ATPase GspE/PulE/Tfp pilus assembly ATPase PilB-like protein
LRGLTELGFSEKNLMLVREILSKSRGIVLVTGPAGMHTLLADALAKAIFGETPIEEVIRVA